MATDSTPDVNRVYFNELSASYDQRYKNTLEQLVDKIRASKDFIGADWVEDEENGESGRKSVRLLDYACGTGVLSMALAPFTTQCVGIDISQGMVDVYNSKVNGQSISAKGLTKDDMFAVVGNLTDPADPFPASLSGPEFKDFDVAGVCLGFHHFEDPELTARRLVDRLRPGGILLILDFFPHAPFNSDEPGDGHSHDHGHGHDNGHGHVPKLNHGDDNLHAGFQNASHTVRHHGFSEERVRSIFEQAGAGTGFQMKAIGTGFAFKGGARTVFIARGVKSE